MCDHRDVCGCVTENLRVCDNVCGYVRVCDCGNVFWGWVTCWAHMDPGPQPSSVVHITHSIPAPSFPNSALSPQGFFFPLPSILVPSFIFWTFTSHLRFWGQSVASSPVSLPSNPQGESGSHERQGHHLRVFCTAEVMDPQLHGGDSRRWRGQGGGKEM